MKFDINKLNRTLHSYLSMFAFAALLFFSLTGLTLNHADWFGAGEPRVETVAGSLPADILKQPDKAAVVEALRRDFRATGAMTAFDFDEFECTVNFNKPGNSCFAMIDRQSGKTEVTIESGGTLAVLKDLHRGKSSGGAWPWVIDLTAVTLATLSITGLVFLLFQRKQRVVRLVALAVGAAVCLAVYALWVP